MVVRKNILTMPLKEAEVELKRRRELAKEEDLTKKKLEAEVKASSERYFKVLRALLTSGDKDSFFTGLNDSYKNWEQEVLKNPEDWIWCRAKYGIIGVPYPDGSEYSFAPGAVFPLYREFKEFVHNTMNGEVREVRI